MSLTEHPVQNVLTRSFLRGAEVWAPTGAGDELELRSASHGELVGFAMVSPDTRFAPGVGLPGRAWAERRPIVMSTSDPAFVRASEAAADHVACAVALPVFAGNGADAPLLGVVVFLCGGDELAGAIEVWSETSGQLDLADGYYGSLRDFELEARATTFGRDSGLPGKVWGSGRPLLLDDLGDAERFLRPQAAVDAGMRIGVGVPVAGRGAGTVVTFLSALDTPLARWVEVWVPDADGSLRFEQGYSNEGVDLTERYADARVQPGHGPLGTVLAEGVPLVTDYAGLDGSTWLIAIPVVSNGAVDAVVTLVS